MSDWCSEHQADNCRICTLAEEQGLTDKDLNDPEIRRRFSEEEEPEFAICVEHNAEMPCEACRMVNKYEKVEVDYEAEGIYENSDN